MRSRHITNLVNRCLNIVTGKGSKITTGNDYNVWLEYSMWLEHKVNAGMLFRLYQESVCSTLTFKEPLSFHLEVIRKGYEVLLDARGQYSRCGARIFADKPSKIYARVYVPGKWEERIMR